MSVIPTFERTLARRCNPIVNSLLRGLFLDTRSRKIFLTERDPRETRRDLIKGVGLKIFGYDHFDILINSVNVACKTLSPPQI
jgi:hypothetical protein